MKNDRTYDNIEFEYVKLKENIEFICDRCGKRKIAKKYARYTKNGENKIICNACYGNLMANVK